MPVSVSLEIVSRVSGTDGLIPNELVQLLKALEADTKDKTLWGVIADWMDECGEDGLSRACRYAMKRPTVYLEEKRGNSPHYRWAWVGVPGSVDGAQIESTTRHTILAAITELAMKLRKHDEEGA